jgi:hypothetical protein
VDDENKKRIEDTLDAFAEETDPSPSLTVSQLGKRSRRGNIRDDGNDESSSDNSNDDIDRLNEDLLRNKESKATGFLGQNATVQWMKSLRHQINSAEATSDGAQTEQRTKAPFNRRQGTRRRAIPHVSDSTFYLDDENVVLEVDVDPYALPLPDVADQLVYIYNGAMQGSYLLLGRRQSFFTLD